MAEILIAPDVVALAIGWLRSELPTIPDQAAVPVHRAVPDPRPPAFITCRLAPGSGIDPGLPVVDNVQLNFEAWAPTVAAAQDLAQNARAVMLAAKGVVISGIQVYRAQDFAGPAELPDPLSNLPRFVFTIQLSVRIRQVVPSYVAHVTIVPETAVTPPEAKAILSSGGTITFAPANSGSVNPESLSYGETPTPGTYGMVVRFASPPGYPGFVGYQLIALSGEDGALVGFWTHPTAELTGPLAWRADGYFLLAP